MIKWSDMRQLWWIIGISVSCWLLSLATQVRASEFSLQVEPAFQEVLVSPEIASASATIWLTNKSSFTQTLELSAVDFVQSDDLGGIQLVNQTDPRYRLAEYVDIANKKVIIQPGDRIPIQVSINNQANLSVGGHYGAVIAKFQSQDVGAVQQILPAVSSLLIVHKQGGEQYHLSLTDVLWDRQFWWSKLSSIRLTFTNNGNIHLAPRGLIKVRTLWGQLVYKGVINESTAYVLPSTKRIMTSQLKPVSWTFPAMIYQVEVSGSDLLEKVPFSWENYVVYISPVVLVGIALVGLGAFLGISRRHK